MRSAVVLLMLVSRPTTTPQCNSGFTMPSSLPAHKTLEGSISVIVDRTDGGQIVWGTDLLFWALALTRSNHNRRNRWQKGENKWQQ